MINELSRRRVELTTLPHKNETIKGTTLAAVLALVVVS
jgi:hypothetical protein